MHASRRNTPTPWARLLALLRGETTHPALAQNRERFASLDQDRPLAEYEFTVLDTELTGLSPRTDEIVSIGAVRIRGLTITADSFYTLVAPRGRVPKVATMIHRITPQMLEGAPRLREVFPSLLDFLGDSLIVGHNVGLDMSFLNRASLDILGGRLRTPCVDTMRLAQVYRQERWENYYDQFDSRVSYQLGDLSRSFGLPAFDQHNAFHDAMQTAYLFLFLVKKLRSGGIETLRDLYMAGRSWRWYM
ncbi:DNA polymerase-3 subunit epsilon [Desulfobaculum xiamenense]|uniref:DNA polymerase-3 subunit epsilon n=1 Tax=Desulfobaculum xiamenense TaxID=995050 RepID=A0A846QGZ4_9BACT|nr:3'-5' exonuclease [Desulfobaculum xiamenense]NJB68086.1 DNA polymerase-3 subunit epsilon [Desulfobaculum xiamenense]